MVAKVEEESQQPEPSTGEITSQLPHSMLLSAGQREPRSTQ